MAMDIDALWINVGQSIISDPERLFTASARYVRLMALSTISRTARDVVDHVLLPEFTDVFVRPELQTLAVAQHIDESMFLYKSDSLLILMLTILDGSFTMYDRGDAIKHLVECLRRQGSMRSVIKIEMDLRWQQNTISRYSASKEYAVDIGDMEADHIDLLILQEPMYSTESVKDLAYARWGSEARMIQALDERHAEARGVLLRRLEMNVRNEVLVRKLGIESSRGIWTLRSMHRHDAELMRLTGLYVQGDDTVFEDIKSRVEVCESMYRCRLRNIAHAMRWNTHLIPSSILNEKAVSELQKIGERREDDVLSSENAQGLCSEHMLVLVATEYMNTGTPSMLEWIGQYIERVTVLLTTVWAGSVNVPMSIPWAFDPSRTYLNLTDDKDAQVQASDLAAAIRVADVFKMCERVWRDHNAGLEDTHVHYIDEQCFYEALALYSHPPRNHRKVLECIKQTHMHNVVKLIRESVSHNEHVMSQFEIEDIIEDVCNGRTLDRSSAEVRRITKNIIESVMI